MKLSYAILSNPAAGKLSIDQKRKILSGPAQILKAPVYGFDSKTPSDTEILAKELVQKADVIVAAGGDGTLSDIINAVDTSQIPVAYLPLGSGNAMKHALHYKGNLCDIAKQIANGVFHDYDLILCDQKRRGFMISAGIDGTVLSLRNQYLSMGMKGFMTYFAAFMNAYFVRFKRSSAVISIDGSTYQTDNLLSLMLMKQPFYGYGLRLMPGAQFDDGVLHGQIIDSHALDVIIGLSACLVTKTVIGRSVCGKSITLKTSIPMILQIDGNIAWQSDFFSFKVVPKALKIRY